MGEEDFNGLLAYRNGEICTFVARKAKLLERDWKKGRNQDLANGRKMEAGSEAAWGRGIHLKGINTNLWISGFFVA